MNEHIVLIDVHRPLVRRGVHTGKMFVYLPTYEVGTDEREAQRLLLMRFQDMDFLIRYETLTGAPILIFEDNEEMLAIFREEGYEVVAFLDLT